MNEYKLIVTKTGPNTFDLLSKAPDKTWERTSFEGLSTEEVNELVLNKLSTILLGSSNNQ